jgi:hypothetical protein
MHALFLEEGPHKLVAIRRSSQGICESPQRVRVEEDVGVSFAYAAQCLRADGGVKVGRVPLHVDCPLIVEQPHEFVEGGARPVQGIALPILGVPLRCYAPHAKLNDASGIRGRLHVNWF